MTTEQTFTCSPIAARWIGYAGIEDEAYPITAASVISTVCEYLCIDRNTPYRRTHRRDVVYPRQLCMYFILTKTHMALKNIGKVFGGYDHTTVMNSKRALLNLFETDMVVRQDMTNLDNLIGPANPIPVKDNVCKPLKYIKKAKPFARPAAQYSNKTAYGN